MDKNVAQFQQDTGVTPVSLCEAAEEQGMNFLPPVTSEDNGDILTVEDGKWGKGDPPYTVGESMSTVFAQQTITTSSYQGTNVAQLPGSVDISVGTPCKVTYNGTAYDVTAQEMSGNAYLGEFSGQAPDFTNYPFFIVVIKNSGMMLYSSAANPTLKIDAIVKTIVPSETFEEAVKISLNNPVFPHIVQVEWVDGQNGFVSRESFDDVLTILDEIEVPVQMQFLYGRFNGLLISLEEKRTSSLTSIQGHFVLNELREVGAIYPDDPTLYTMIWTSANGIEINTQELSVPSTPST